MRTIGRQLLPLALVLWLCSACSGSAQPEQLVVFAAASLTDAFTEITTAFETQNPDVNVVLNFAGSQVLRSQLAFGGTADLFAPADPGYLAEVVTAESVVTFAANQLALIVPFANPANIISYADLAQPGVRLVLAAPEVPAGAYAATLIANLQDAPDVDAQFAARVTANVVSAETNVRQVVTKVRLGEADAGIVYRSDVTPAVTGEVTMVPLPELYNVVTQYALGIPTTTENPAGAARLIAFILSGAGQEILARWGLQPLHS
jgi:molybdate transport system substrate-binding protein